MEWRGVLVRLCPASAMCSDVDAPLDLTPIWSYYRGGRWKRLMATHVCSHCHDLVNTWKLAPGCDLILVCYRCRYGRGRTDEHRTRTKAEISSTTRLRRKTDATGRNDASPAASSGASGDRRKTSEWPVTCLRQAAAAWC